MIPVSLRCEFHKKARGHLTLRSGGGAELRARLEADSAACTHEQLTTITDASGALCASVWVTFTIDARRDNKSKSEKKTN